MLHQPNYNIYITVQKRKGRYHINIRILSKEQMLSKLNTENFLENTAVISFYDPPNAKGCRATPLDYKEKTNMLFQVAVNDIDLEVLSEYGFTYETFFTEAEELAEFINEALEKNMNIICQCEYGQSRSAACAAAILEFYESNGISIFADYRYYPNQLIYHKVIDALNKKKC